MSRTGYFAPGIVGALVGLIYAVFGGSAQSAVDRLILGCGLVPLLFVICQLLMLAAQGVFAGVLPVPFGKSLRGTKCAVIGVLVVVALAAGAVSSLLARVEIGPAALVVGGVSLACWLVALGLYVWSLATAVTDFVD